MIHPRDNDLIAATHGRGIWIMDDITPLQQLSEKVTSAEAHLFENRTATQWLRIQPHGTGGTLSFRGENPTRNAVDQLLPRLGARPGRCSSRSPDVTGENKRTLTVPARAGHQPARVADAFDPSPEAGVGVRAAAGGGAAGRPPGRRWRWRRRRWRRRAAVAAAARRASPRLRVNTA